MENKTATKTTTTTLRHPTTAATVTFTTEGGWTWLHYAGSDDAQVLLRSQARNEYRGYVARGWQKV